MNNGGRVGLKKPEIFTVSNLQSDLTYIYAGMLITNKRHFNYALLNCNRNRLDWLIISTFTRIVLFISLHTGNGSLTG